MNFKFIVIIISLISSLSALSLTTEEYKNTLLAKTDQELYDLASASDSALGQCRVQNASFCERCFCDRYVRTSAVGTFGHDGWPKNPSTGDSTGCVVWPSGPKAVGTCWGGYSQATMCTNNMVSNAAAQLRDALNRDACGLSAYVATLRSRTTFIANTEIEKIIFVDLSETGGKNLKCGTVGLNHSIEEDERPEHEKTQFFSELPSAFCRSAYIRAKQISKTSNRPLGLRMIGQERFNLLKTQTRRAFDKSEVERYVASTATFGTEGEADVQMILNLNLADPTVSNQNLSKLKRYAELKKGSLQLPSSTSAEVFQKISALQSDASFNPVASKPTVSSVAERTNSASHRISE